MCVDRHGSAMVHRWRSVGPHVWTGFLFPTEGSNLAWWQESLSTDSFFGCSGGDCNIHGMRPASETGVWDVQKHLIVQGRAAYNKTQAQQDISDSKVGKDWFRHTQVHY